MKLSGDYSLFPQKKKPFFRWGLLIVLIAACSLLFNAYQNDEIEPLFQPTPLPTRTSDSYRQEGAAYFSAGDLNASINAYLDALRIDPNNAQVMAELARIQTYSSSTLTQEPKANRLQEALEMINHAVEIDPENSDAHAIRALVLDWNAGSPLISQEQHDNFLLEAEQAATRATQINSQNVLAQAYLAEVLIDQQNWLQARQLAERALALNPNLMDTHRVMAVVLESIGEYPKAIEEYKLAAAIEPNLTFLYIAIGVNYRTLGRHEEALEYFDRAATINKSLGIQDPLPYIAIAKTYIRDGQFFIAALNVQSALSFDPTNADTYGQLGIVRSRGRNFEGAIPVLHCAVRGCSAEENEELGVAVVGLALQDASLEYYLAYSSLLSAFGECDGDQGSLILLAEIEANYANDPITMDVVEENRNVCASFKTGG
ncbi:MAG: tetratricopeptide repeat protein [Anaerolineae bacterium]|nr:tetratricopeptide repeat protein [Anaerolineae bacterium]